MAKSLKTITLQIAARHKRKNKAEADLKKARKEFFDAAREHWRSQPLAQKLLSYEVKTLNEAHTLAIQEYPAWIVIGSRPYPDEAKQIGWEIMIEENPEYKAYEFTHPDLNLVFTKEVRAGSVTIDDERLKEKDPDLYKKVFKRQTQWVPRDFDSLDPDTLAQVQEYIYRDTPTLALPAPKKAKVADE